MTTSQAIQPCLPPQARQFQDREGITDKHPSALIAAGTEITYSHPSALLAAGMEITSSHPSAPSQQEWESQQAPVFLLPTTTDIARQLSRLPWRYFCLYKGLSMMPTDRTPSQAAWRHERR
ncbi:MAG: hypothetical protein PUD32_09305 [Bacteroidales bacterium]|nr:hypothetical protein [Bacteroidales bacterium]